MDIGMLLLVALIITAIVTLVRVVLDRSARGEAGKSEGVMLDTPGAHCAGGGIDKVETKRKRDDQTDGVEAV